MQRLPFLIVGCFGCLGYLWGLHGPGLPGSGASSARPDPRPVFAGDLADADARREAFVRLTSDPRGPTCEDVRRGLADADVRVRRLVAEWLGEHDVGGRISLLCTALRDREMDATVRSTAAAALVRIRSEECIPLLIEQLEDSDPNVRLYAIQILESMTGDSLGYQPYCPTRARVAKAEEWRRWWVARTAK